MKNFLGVMVACCLVAGVATEAKAQGFSVVSAPADSETIDCATIKVDSRSGTMYCVYQAVDRNWYAFPTSASARAAAAAVAPVEVNTAVDVDFPSYMMDEPTYRATLAGAIEDGLKAAVPPPQKWYENELLWVGVATVVVGAVVAGLAAGGVFSSDPGPTNTTISFQ